MKISEIRTNLFTQVTITDYGVRFVIFDNDEWKRSGLTAYSKSVFTVTVNVCYDGRIVVMTTKANRLTTDQLDEIQRISKIIRTVNKNEKNETE